MTIGNGVSFRTPEHRTATLVAVGSAFVVTHLLFLILPQVFESWNAQTIDELFLLRSRIEGLRPRYDSTVVHVDIFDRTLVKLKNSYLSRSEYAQVVRNLSAMGVGAQVWDFIFPARSNRTDDSVFIASCLSAGNVYLGLAFNVSAEKGQGGADVDSGDGQVEGSTWKVKFEGDRNDLPLGFDPVTTFPELARVSAGLGFLNLSPDRDGVFRRAPLLLRYGEATYPSISLRVVCDYLKVSPDQIVVRPGKAITLKDARFRNGVVHDIVIPIDGRGNMVVNYTGPWRGELWQPMKHYDFADLLRASDDAEEMELWKDELGGRIAIVSQVTTGSADVGAVPTDPEFPKSGIHANVVHTILTQNFLHELSTVEMLVIELLLAAAALALALRLSSVMLSGGILGLLVAYLAGAGAAFLYGGVIVAIIRPALMLVIALTAIVAHRYVREEKEKLATRRSFESYFPPAIVKKIMADPAVVMAAGQKKELTILFSDIKGFTRYSSHVPPDRVQKMLNEYFAAMTEIVFWYGGTLDKFIGDGLMVFFGDPEPQSDHALRCVRAAIDMQRKARELRLGTGGEPMQIRIGINTGVVVVGNMGSGRRLSYTVIGSDVNLAQRLETKAPAGGILISQRTFDLVRNDVRAVPRGELILEGIDEPTRVYEVLVEDHRQGQG